MVDFTSLCVSLALFVVTFVYLGCRNKVLQPEWLKQQIYFSLLWRLEVKMLADDLHSEALSLDLQEAASCCVLT